MLSLCVIETTAFLAILIPLALIFFVFLAHSFQIHIIQKALKKYIIPRLTEKGFVFINYKGCGFFYSSNFSNRDDILPFVFMRGNPSIPIFIYVNYTDSGDKKTVTARIDTLFGFLRKVVYSDNTFN